MYCISHSAHRGRSGIPPPFMYRRILCVQCMLTDTPTITSALWINRTYFLAQVNWRHLTTRVQLMYSAHYVLRRPIAQITYLDSDNAIPLPVCNRTGRGIVLVRSYNPLIMAFDLSTVVLSPSVPKLLLPQQSALELATAQVYCLPALIDTTLDRSPPLSNATCTG